MNVKAFGQKKSIAEWIKDSRCVVNYQTLRNRLINNWSPEEALTTPQRGKRKKLSLEEQNEVLRKYSSGKYIRHDLAKKYNVSEETISRVLRGVY